MNTMSAYVGSYTGISAIAKALVKAQHDIKAVAKDSTNPHFKNRYASLDAIMEMVRPTLANYGMAVTQDGASVTDETGSVTAVTVRTTLIHESGENISNIVTMPLDKATAQGVGSALTYGRRYGLSALLALTTDEDDDGAKASERAPARQTTGSVVQMRIGKSKGQPLAEVDERDLESAIAWARKTDAKKFDQAIGEMTSELARRQMEVGVTPQNLDRLLQEDARDLPFPG